MLIEVNPTASGGVGQLRCGYMVSITQKVEFEWFESVSLLTCNYMLSLWDRLLVFMPVQAG